MLPIQNEAVATPVIMLTSDNLLTNAKLGVRNVECENLNEMFIDEHW